jgi:ABC-type transport system involved in multi-copper enzyme maturation permease subunit
MMFNVLLWKEIREHLMTFRFAAALVTTFMLVVISVWVLGDDYLRRRDLANTLSQTSLEMATKVFVPSQIRPVVQRPPSALSIFASGEDVHLGDAVEIRRWNVPSRADDNMTENKLLASMQPFDLSAIIVVAVSLFGVLLSYDSFSGERERGTLKLLCAFPQKRGEIFTVKFIAGSVVLALPLLVSLLCALLLLLFVHGINFNQAEWLAIALMFCSSVLYGAFFVAVGLVGSALVTRSSTSLALGLLFWTVLVILLPSAGNGLASSLHPLLNPEEISKFDQESSQEVQNKVRDFRERNNLELSSYGDSGIDGESPFYYDGLPLWFRDHMRYIGYNEQLHQQRAEQLWNLESKHLDRKREQYGISAAINSLSPAFLFRSAINSLAATDYASYADFMEQCRRYRRALMDDFRSKGFFDSHINRFFSRWEMSDMQSDEQAIKRSEEMLARYRAGTLKGPEDLWKPLPEDFAPPFSYQGGGPGIIAALGPLAAIALMTTVVFSIGFIAFIRYDVR